MKYSTIKDIIARLKGAGLPHSKRTILRWEEQGKLKIMRLPHSKTHARRVITEEQLEELIKAFSPGGRGWWSYDGKKIKK